MKQIKDLTFTFKVIFKNSPLYGVISIIESIFSSLFNIVFNLIFLKLIADMVIMGYKFEEIIPYVFLVLGLLVITSLLKYIKECLQNLAENNISANLHKNIFAKSTTIDFEAFEDTNFYSNFILSLKDIDTNIIGHFKHSIRLLFLLSNLIGTITVITVISPIYLAIFFFAILINFVALLFENKILFNHTLEMTNLNRRGEYINRIFYRPEYVKEIKSYGMRNELMEKYSANINEMSINIDEYKLKLMGLDIFTNFFASAFLIDGLLMLKLTYDVIILKSLTIGSVITMIRGVSNLQWILEDIVVNIGEMRLKSEYIDIYKKFLNYENKIESGNLSIHLDAINTLEFKDVWFKYPFSDKYALKNINLSINSTDKIGLVGRNGAGKSTLIKLILRFYDVDKGEILFNGINIKEYNLKEYRSLFESVFQDYNIYAATIEDNILLGEKSKDMDLAIESVGLNRLGHKGISLNTFLNKEIYEDAVDLSGGERQKIAISRSLINRKDKFLFLYDEPNSYLDAVSEYEIVNNLNELLKNKSSLIISHRFATIQDSDLIYLLKNGEIKEVGTHSKLMKLDGDYALMYNTQSKRYLD